MFISKYAVSNSKKSRFWKEEEDSDLSSSLGIKMPFMWLRLMKDILF